MALAKATNLTHEAWFYLLTQVIIFSVTILLCYTFTQITLWSERMDMRLRRFKDVRCIA